MSLEIERRSCVKDALTTTMAFIGATGFLGMALIGYPVTFHKLDLLDRIKEICCNALAKPATPECLEAVSKFGNWNVTELCVPETLQDQIAVINTAGRVLTWGCLLTISCTVLGCYTSRPIRERISLIVQNCRRRSDYSALQSEIDDQQLQRM